MNRRNFMTNAFWGWFFLSIVVAAPLSFTNSAAASTESDGRLRWDNMPPEQKKALLERWKEFSALGKEDQGRLWEALARYQSLPSEEQARIQKNFDRWKKYSPDQKAKIRNNFQEFKSLSEGEQKNLQDKAKSDLGNTAK